MVMTIIYLTGINQVHTGVEAELSAKLNEMFRVDLGLGYGKWVYTDDAEGMYRNSEGTDESYSYSIKDLKVGDAPQVSVIMGLTVYPIDDLTVQGLVRHYRRHYSDWDPTSREYSEGDRPDRATSWLAPEYTVVDINVSYKIPFEYNGVGARLVLNVRNALDEVYIQDAVDNSRYNAYPSRVNDHSANAAEVYFGMPTSYNLGLKINF